MKLNPLRSLLVAVLAAAAVSCGQPDDPSVLRFLTEQFEIKVWPDISPPRAVERITYTVVVRDNDTKEPIVNEMCWPPS